MFYDEVDYKKLKNKQYQRLLLLIKSVMKSYFAIKENFWQLEEGAVHLKFKESATRLLIAVKYGF